MNEVVVLMSTYNGEKYLTQQIDSILTQKGVSLKLLIRNDGGNRREETLKILNNYIIKDNRIDVIKGENIGCANSFWELLKKAPKSDFYAFADQDDYWFEDKLASAVNFLKGCNNSIPQLYCCAVEVVDENLNKIDVDAGGKNYATTFPITFVKSLAPGCTFVFNEAARKKCIEYCSCLDIHDWTMAKIVSLFGEIHYDSIQHMYYRQHGNNVIGASGGLKRILKAAHRLFKNTSSRVQIASNILNTYYEQLSTEQVEKLKIFINYKKNFKNKIKLIKDKEFMPKGFIDRVGFKIFVILGKI